VGFERARPVALLACLIVVTGLAAPANAATRLERPSVSLRVSAGDLVIMTGRTATSSARVRLQRHTSWGWRLVKRTRAHHHRYAITARVAAGTTATFRVTSNHRSRKVVVRMPAPRTPAPAQPTTYDACGARPLKADGTPWTCTFDDDFDGSALDRTKWVPQTYFTSGTEENYACYRDDPSNVDVHDGMLTLTMLKLDAPAPCGVDRAPTPLQSGMVTTYHLFSQQYGRFEARIRNTATSAPGLHEAFWLWPDDRVPSTETWPNAGEIDVSETYSVHPDLSIPFLHYSADADGPRSGVNTAWDCTAQRGQWNTYTLEWAPRRIEIQVNGRTCLVNTSGDPAFQKPYIISLTQGLGSEGNEMGPDTPFPATMDVDYVRVWK
jgi:beta-glucanase (GH16 family)